MSNVKRGKIPMTAVVGKGGGGTHKNETGVNMDPARQKRRGGKKELKAAVREKKKKSELVDTRGRK